MGGLIFFSDFYLKNSLSDFMRIVCLGFLGIGIYISFSLIFKLNSYIELKSIIFRK